MPPEVLGLCLHTWLCMGCSFGAETKCQAVLGGLQRLALAAAGTVASKQASTPPHTRTAPPKRFTSARVKTVTVAPSLLRVLGHSARLHVAPPGRWRS